jgi:hypothetical protein
MAVQPRFLGPTGTQGQGGGHAVCGFAFEMLCDVGYDADIEQGSFPHCLLLLWSQTFVLSGDLSVTCLVQC